jgi:hypothetical protein
MTEPPPQEGDPHSLDREGEPRGGAQSDEYRHSDPRELVEEDDVAMGGAAGAPQEGKSVEERREESERWREAKQKREATARESDEA